MPNTPAGTDEALVRLSHGAELAREWDKLDGTEAMDAAYHAEVERLDKKAEATIAAALTRLATAERQRDAAVGRTRAVRGAFAADCMGCIRLHAGCWTQNVLDRFDAALAAYDATPGPKPSEESA
jgi:hypothetical protein